MAGCIETAVQQILEAYTRFIYKAKMYEVPELTGERVRRSFAKTKDSAGALNGWSPKEMSLLSKGICDKIAILLNQVEAWGTLA